MNGDGISNRHCRNNMLACKIVIVKEKVIKVLMMRAMNWRPYHLISIRLLIVMLPAIVADSELATYVAGELSNGRQMDVSRGQCYREERCRTKRIPKKTRSRSG